MRVLVTGGCGFIGSHVVDALVARGADVVVADNLLPLAHGQEPPYLNPAVDYRRIDIRDLLEVERLVSDVDSVCHHAAMVGLGVAFTDVVDYASNNDLGTAVLLRALDARGFRGRFVLASSMVVYGEGAYECGRHGALRPAARSRSDLESGRYDPRCPKCGSELEPRPVTEELAPDPRSVYAATKLHQEHLCFLFGREKSLPVAALRYHNVYGARMPRGTPYAGVASIFRSALSEGRAPEVFEDGAQRRDFVHVTDVAEVNADALFREEPVTGTFNIASGLPRTIGDMAEALAAAFGPDGPKPKVTGAFRLGDVRHVFAATNRAESLGWRARVSFEEGMSAFATDELRGSPIRSF